MNHSLPTETKATSLRHEKRAFPEKQAIAAWFKTCLGNPRKKK
jgi:hypothetical protein